MMTWNILWMPQLRTRARQYLGAVLKHQQGRLYWLRLHQESGSQGMQPL